MPAAATRSPDVTTWGFIGSGEIGSTVARLAVGAGHHVVMSNSRGPETLADLVAELGPRARAADPATAAEAGDAVVVSIPLGALWQLPAAALDGKVVIDTMNYYPRRDGRIAALDEETTTTSELLQAHLPGSRVVKAFNNIRYWHIAELARPVGSSERSALAIAGDDPGAKALVRALLDDIGWDAYDLGPLAEGWRIQRDTPAYGLPYAAEAEAWWDQPPRRTTTSDLAVAAALAKR